MTWHTGQHYRSGNVSLVAPDSQSLAAVSWRDPEGSEWREWRERAGTEGDIYYFAIKLGSEFVGEIFLHDIDLISREALIGYHIFDVSHRGSGTGTRALQLLQEFVATETSLKRLVIITAEDNLPSRRIAERCGFALAGASWEDPQLVVYELKPPNVDLAR